MITKFYEKYSIVINRTKHYDNKIQKFITENNLQNTKTDPTETFPNQIRETINQTKTLSPQNSK
jgi:MinD superfamily P-loop ATPase